MNNNICTGYELKKALGKSIDEIKDLDNLSKERNKTKNFRKSLIFRYGERCSYCGEGGVIEAAHIIPLEIGAKTTEKNLILLCKKCHLLYDNGYLSITKMAEVANAWRAGEKPTRLRPALDSLSPPKPTITPPPKSVADLFTQLIENQRKSKYLKAIKIVDKGLQDTEIDDDGRTYLLIKRGELSRRRSARGAVEKALETLSNIEYSTVPEIYKSVYFYELNYVNRLLGRHADAAQICAQCLKFLENKSTSSLQTDYVAVAANQILCEMAALEKVTAKNANDWKARLFKLENIAEAHGGYWGGRWARNCASHTLQVYLRAGWQNKVRSCFDRIQEQYFESDVSNGWDAAGRQTRSMLEGLVFVLHPESAEELKTGVELLARSFLSRLGYRQRPEGIRDAGFGLAIGLQKMGKKQSVASMLEATMHRVIDGTSVLWPYRAN